MILASDLLVYLYLSKGRNWRLGLHFPKRLLLHFCLSISIISKISQSQTTRVAARPFVSFASAKVGIKYVTRKFYQRFLYYFSSFACISDFCSTFAAHLNKEARLHGDVSASSGLCLVSGCSAVGSALRSGRRGRAFESPHPDSGATNRKILFVAFYLLLIDAI